MPATISGDYSKFPEPVRGALPYIAGEICEIRQSWSVFHHLFMDDKERLDTLGGCLGHLLGVFQSLLQDQLILSIARLTDKDRGKDKNLSIWRLKDAIMHAASSDFEHRALESERRIEAAVKNLRIQRHKKIAHFDLHVSLGVSEAPLLTFSAIREALEELEIYWNLFSGEFENSTTLFDALPAYDITGAAEVTCNKAIAYDELEKERVIPFNEWKHRADIRGRDPMGVSLRKMPPP